MEGAVVGGIRVVRIVPAHVTIIRIAPFDALDTGGGEMPCPAGHTEPLFYPQETVTPMRKTLAAVSVAAVLAAVAFTPPAVAAPTEDPSVRFDGRHIHLSSQTLHDYAALLQQQVEELADPVAIIEARLPDAHGDLAAEYVESLDTGLEVLSVESDVEYGELDTTAIEGALAGEVYDQDAQTGERASALIFDLPEGRVSFDARYYVKEGQARGYKGKLGGKWRGLPHLDAYDLDNAFESATVEITLGHADTPVATIDLGLTGTTDDLRDGHGVTNGVVDDPRTEPAFEVETTFLPEATAQDRAATARINEHLWQIVAHDTGHSLAIATYSYFTPDLPPEPWDPQYPLDDPAQHPLFHTAVEQLYTHMFSLGNPHTLLSFSDVDEWHTYYQPVRWMVVEDITQGYADGTFLPGRSVTRGETASFLYRYVDPESTIPQTSPFADVSTDSSHYPAIAWMRAEQMVSGYRDGSYRPNRQITRGEAAKLLYEMADPDFTAPAGRAFTDVDGQDTYHQHTAWLKEVGLAHGYADGSYRTHRNITRGELAQLIYQYDNEVAR